MCVEQNAIFVLVNVCRMVKTYARLHKSMEILEYFTTRSWEWMHGHLDTLKSQMSPEDQKVCIIYSMEKNLNDQVKKLFLWWHFQS